MTTPLIGLSLCFIAVTHGVCDCVSHWELALVIGIGKPMHCLALDFSQTFQVKAWSNNIPFLYAVFSLLDHQTSDRQSN